MAALVELVIAFSILKEYTAVVKPVPEALGGESSTGGLASLASMAGINMGGMNSTDALAPNIYPNIVVSVPFMTKLFDLKITPAKKGSPQTTVYDYMTNDMRSPWW